MNRKSFLMGMGLFLLLASSGWPQVTINVITRTPMPAELSVWERDPSLIQVIIVNPAGSPAYPNARLSFFVRNVGTGEIAARSQDEHPHTPRLNIPAGPSTTVLNSVEVINLQAVIIASHLRAIATATNRLPEGQFDFCVRVLDQHGRELATTGDACPGFTVITPDPPSLIFPQNGDTLVAGTWPTFTWTPVSTLSEPANFNLKIAPMFAGQDARYAIDHNEPLFEERGIISTSFLYPPSAPPFSLYPTAVGFAWQVTAVNAFGLPLTHNLGRSEIFVFFLSGGILAQDASKPDCKCECEVVIKGPSEIYWHWNLARFKNKEVQAKYGPADWEAVVNMKKCTAKKPYSYKWSSPLGAVMRGREQFVMTLFDPGITARSQLREQGEAKIEILVTVTVTHHCPDERVPKEFSCKASKIVTVKACLDPAAAHDAKAQCASLKERLAWFIVHAEKLAEEALVSRFRFESDMQLYGKVFRYSCLVLFEQDQAKLQVMGKQFKTAAKEMGLASVGSLLKIAGQFGGKAVEVMSELYHGIEIGIGVFGIDEILAMHKEIDSIEEAKKFFQSALIDAKIQICRTTRSFGDQLDRMKQLDTKLAQAIAEAEAYDGCLDCRLDVHLTRAKSALVGLRKAYDEYLSTYKKYQAWIDWCAGNPSYGGDKVGQACKDAPAQLPTVE